MASNDLSQLVSAPKGSYVGAEALSDMIEESVGTDAYRLKLLEIRDKIMAHHSESGVVVTVKIEGNGLRVLTDEEASEYNHHRFGKTLLTLNAVHRRASGVDSGNLTPETKAQHVDRLSLQGRFIQALTSEAEKIRTPLLEPHQTPIAQLFR